MRELFSEYLSMDAVSISSNLLPRLGSGFNARVHSVFDSSFNCLGRDGAFITIADKRKGNVPNGILVNRPYGYTFESLGLKRDMLIKSSGSVLFFPETGIRISLDKAGIWQVQAKFNRELLSIDEIKANLLCVKKAARANSSKKGLGILLRYSGAILRGDVIEDDVLDYFNYLAFQSLSGLVKGIRARDFEVIEKTVSGLIGLGVGLTPSGDDVLLGIISGMSCLGHYSKESDYILKISDLISCRAKDKTTMVSQSYLQCAARGEFSEALADMLKAVLYSKGTEVSSSALKVIAVGSSSGQEIVLGVLLGLELGMELFDIGRN
ncbi:MAG: DUF2877 domain-containing protein [Candidatus Omnitrophica bacterium]|nr:DUF2877 domain-containing protein [Candidatus Omnitrophota bacterium]